MEALLAQFRSVFEGQPYLHRISTTGDRIAGYLYDDLLALGRSSKFANGIKTERLVLNTLNRVTGRVGRRGDGTFGERVPSAPPLTQEGTEVRRGAVAEMQIGVEVKIMATKMIAQIDRVIGDLQKQAHVFQTQNVNALRVGIVGVNFAKEYTGHEGARTYVAKKPPAREAPEIVKRLIQYVTPSYDELLILQFSATNRPPFTFNWVNEQATRNEYSSALIRLSNGYEQRF